MTIPTGKKRGRPRKSVEQLEASGTLRSRSKEFVESRKSDEQIDAGGPLSRTADHIDNPAVKDAYRMIVDCAPKGVLRESDQPIVSQAAVLYARLLRDQGITSGEHQHLTRIFGLIGCSPIDRQRLHLPKKPEDKGTGRLGFLEIVKS